ncbi:MAG: exodeoxyribonuclease V subunit alpha, partial [Chlamydiota bacterium]|nr:exodeoxyribonuclease V subunit alpha [Chlamydiota bacterium]
EYDHVTLMLPKGSEQFGRAALYTGITRARSSFQIIGEEETLNATLLSQRIPLSGLTPQIQCLLSQ